ncbi:NitT/TauT family transport system permease protein [Alteribacillus persepolensis]|uniref:NitT/TauT family transport system permease protein n=1 Tax=Alteribacillus persepolensis TaxID=568899 RepID=A0A1G8DGS0_9BACI|nr:NitT/TauT family transport system permease protein [Alteribacillus persepolensis]
MLFFIILIAIWEAIYRLNLSYEFFSVTAFPSPINSVTELYIGFFETGILTEALFTSIQRLLVGFIIAVIIGSLLGLLLARSKIADETLGSLVIALQSIPSIVWLPIMLMLFGSGTLPIILIVTLGGTWVMTSNMRLGIKSVQPILIRAARTMGYKGSELIWHVMIPAAVPSFLSGTRLAWAFGWRALMAAELIGSGGLGRTLMDARDFYNMDLVIAIMIIIATIGLIMEFVIFDRIEKKVFARWGLS